MRLFVVACAARANDLHRCARDRVPVLTVPKELWHLVDFLHRHGINEPGLFVTSGDEAAIGTDFLRWHNFACRPVHSPARARSRYPRATGHRTGVQPSGPVRAGSLTVAQAFGDVDIHSVAECLVRLLERLADPVRAAARRDARRATRACAVGRFSRVSSARKCPSQAISSRGERRRVRCWALARQCARTVPLTAFCVQALVKLSPPKYNTFIYIVSFLREVGVAVLLGQRGLVWSVCLALCRVLNAPEFRSHEISFASPQQVLRNKAKNQIQLDQLGEARASSGATDRQEFTQPLCGAVQCLSSPARSCTGTT